MGFTPITEVATRIAGQLPNEGNSTAFREFAWRYVNDAKAPDDMSEPINYQEPAGQWLGYRRIADALPVPCRGRGRV